MTKKFILVLCFLFCMPNLIFAAQIEEISAKSAMLVDQKTGKVLHAKNEHERVFPASTTKILTAILAMEYLDMDELYVVGREINDIPLDSSKAGHVVGESIIGLNLIRGLIIPSGNETACVVAMQVAKKASGQDLNYAQAEQYFSDMMNEKAKELGALDSNFVNPHGYHNENHYTTAYDMTLIAREAMNNEVIRDIVKEKSFVGNGAGDKKTDDLITNDYSWNSHNLLLNSNEYSYPYANGIKTGFTNEAGSSVVASAEKDGKFFIATVFFSPEPGRWIDSKNLFEFGFDNFNYETLVGKLAPVSNMVLDKPLLGQSEDMELVAENEFVGLFSKEEMQKITNNITINPENLVTVENSESTLKTPLKKGDLVGSVVYTLDGQEVFKTNLLAGQDAERRTIVTDIKYYFNLAKTNAFTLKAVPYWGGGILFIALVVFIISKIKKGGRKGYGYY